MANQDTTWDEEFLEIFLGPIRKCATYKPAFGQGKGDGYSLDQFQELYGRDPLYRWLGLDDSRVYSAHKAAGGLTSVYRQIGIGGERLFRGVIKNSLEIDESDLNWSYEYDKPNGKPGTHTLDAMIPLEALGRQPSKRLKNWLVSASAKMGQRREVGERLTGVVFEVRQGYKSADSKRQNADLRFGMRAYQADLLPAFSVLSTQVSDPVSRRYRADGMLMLTGTEQGDSLSSTFSFCREIVDYDLASFFSRNTEAIKAEVVTVVGALLNP